MNQKKKVLQFIYSGPGGLGTYWMYWIRGDKEREFEHVVVFTGDQDLYAGYVDFCIMEGIEYFFIRKGKGFDWSTYSKIGKILRDQRPDYILLHQPSLVFPVWKYSFLRKTTYFSIEHTPADAKKLSDKLFSTLALLISKKCIFFYNSQPREMLGPLSSLFKNKISIINKGIDSIKYRPSDRSKGSDVIRIGMQGRLEEGKDHATLIRAFAIVCSTHSNSKLELEIAGVWHLKSNLEHLANDLGIRDRIIFCGWLSGDRQLKFLQEIDIYVHATFGETVCYAIMEAQACGCPIIASNVRGVKEVIEDGVDGLLFEPSNHKSLANCLAVMISDSALRKKFALRSRLLVLDKYSDHGMFKTYRKLFDAEK